MITFRSNAQRTFYRALGGMGQAAPAPAPVQYAPQQASMAGGLTSSPWLMFIGGAVLMGVFGEPIKAALGLGSTLSTQGIKKLERKISPGALPNAPRLPPRGGYADGREYGEAE